MKKVSLNELGIILGDECSDYFKTYFSDNIDDYMDDIRVMELNATYDKKEDLFYGNLEISYNKKLYNKDIYIKYNDDEIEYYI